jgi:hypothetical protein
MHVVFPMVCIPLHNRRDVRVMQINASTEAFEERRQSAFRINLADILQHVGPGQYQFIGVVSKAWHGLVHTVPSVNPVDTVTVLSRMTTYDAVFASTSRCRWALDTGFELGKKSATHAAGLLASIETLTMILEKLRPHTLVKTIISNRSIEVLQWAMTHMDSKNFDKGDEEGTKWYMCNEPWCTAAGFGNLQALQLLATHHTLRTSTDLIACAADSSHWHVVDYLRAQPEIERDDKSSLICLQAEARDQRVDIAQFLLKDHHKNEVHAVYRGSIHSGNIDKVRLLQRLYDEHFDITDGDFDEAVKGGHLYMCIYLVDNSSSEIIDDSSLLTAAELGHTHILKWGVNLVREQRSVNVRSLILRVACSTGCVDTLQFLYPHLPAEGNTAGFTHGLSYAAVRGFLEAAKWFKEKGGCWPSTLGDGSANWPNHLVEWARRENCTAPLHIT